MLCQFTVKNYKSFKESATLDFEAANIDNDDKILVDADNSKFLPLAVIYGPNGGGKSNILDALFCLASKVMSPLCAICNENNCSAKYTKSMPIIPFKLDEDSINAATEFELYFRTSSAEYQYRIHFKNEKVIYESLFKINIGENKKINIFTRDINSKESLYLSNDLNKISVQAVSDTLPWLSYFSITNNKIPVIEDVISWFHKLNFIDYSNPFADSQILIVNGKMKDIELKMLKEMDIDIEDYKLEQFDNNNNKKFTTYHIVNGIKTEFDINEESGGTVKLLTLMPLLVNSILEGEILVVDELDAKLHPKLLQYIIELFSHKKSNKHNAQLIFTSHDISTMTPQIFRRDEIWFAAKNYEQSSSLYSLVEIKKENGAKPRNDEKYGKQYLEGRYGADPYLKRILNWEEEQ